MIVKIIFILFLLQTNRPPIEEKFYTIVYDFKFVKRKILCGFFEMTITHIKLLQYISWQELSKRNSENALMKAILDSMERTS